MTSISIESRAPDSKDGWIPVGWIMNPPCSFLGKTFEEMKAHACRSDHGEERITIDRADGTGADCYYRELG